MKPIFYGSCAPSETESAKWEMVGVQGQNDGPFYSLLPISPLIGAFGSSCYHREQNGVSMSAHKCESQILTVRKNGLYNDTTVDIYSKVDNK